MLLLQGHNAWIGKWWSWVSLENTMAEPSVLLCMSSFRTGVVLPRMHGIDGRTMDGATSSKPLKVSCDAFDYKGVCVSSCLNKGKWHPCQLILRNLDQLLILSRYRRSVCSALRVKWPYLTEDSSSWPPSPSWTWELCGTYRCDCSSCHNPESGPGT